MSGSNGQTVKRTQLPGGQWKRVPEEEARLIAALYLKGWTLKKLKQKFQHGQPVILRILARQGVEQRTPAQYCPRPNPTPEEIEAATAKIREHWSEKEHRRRAGITRTPYTVPEVDFGPRRNGVPMGNI